MLSILDFSALALYVYKGKTPKSVIPRNMAEIIIMPQLQENTNNPFYASLFIKSIANKPIAAVLAIRGTDDLHNDIRDIETWGDDVLGINKALKAMPNYLGPALGFCYKVNNYCRRKLHLPQNKIYITGHSLGGAIASLLRCKSHMPNQVITFNAPGVRTMPGVDVNVAGILNIRARYDIVSAIDEPVGPYWDVNVPQKAIEAEKLFKLYQTTHTPKFEQTASLWDKFKDKLVMGDEATEVALSQHSMLNLYTALKQQNSIGIAHRSYTSLALSATSNNFNYAAMV